MLPWLGGSLMFVLYPRACRRDSQTSADGGRPARIDGLMEWPREPGLRPSRTEMEARSRSRKIFPAHNVLNQSDNKE